MKQPRHPAALTGVDACESGLSTMPDPPTMSPVSERNHAHNPGTGPLGPNFSRRNRQEPTDESGYPGGQLHGHDR